MNVNENTSAQKREAHARRLAKAHGLLLRKSRTRNTEHVSFDGYMLLDTATNVAIAGSWPYSFNLTLDEVEAYFRE